MDLLAFFRTSEVLPHPNPVTGGHEWFHGTPAHYDGWDDEGVDGEGDTTSPPAHNPKTDSEWFEHASDHWNTALGTHWTSEPKTAEFFAKGQSYSIPHEQSRVAHAHLMMSNPKHYPTEFHMTGDAIHWAKQNGYKHLPEEPEAREHWSSGDADSMDATGAETASGKSIYSPKTQVSYQEHPFMTPSRDGKDFQHRQSIAEIDDDHHDMTGEQLHDKYGSALDPYLGTHPFRDEITQGFKQHLKSQGHDGVTYGNMYEQPTGHTCAIPFNDEQVHLQRWRHLSEPSARKWDKTGSKAGAEPSGIHHPGRVHSLAHESGEGMELPTPSHDMPVRKGYFPGEDLTGIDKGPHVGWVKTEHLIPLREYDRAGSDANPDSREKIDSIRRTMRANGMTDPVIVAHDPHSDRGYLCEGNHRLQAAIEEGWPALPVHVTRAYRSETDKMGRQHYFGSHKVQPDPSGYTPGSLSPSESMPDEWLHTGDAGLRPKTSAVTPKPEWDESQDYDGNRDRRSAWTRHIRHGLSTGTMSNEDAIASGYHGQGHDDGPDTVFGPRTLGWKPMPQHLYHVTTDVAGTLQHGLKSRDELNQSLGKGLGGGESDTISLTDDHELAKSILHSMREFHDVVNGKKTPAHMWDEAQQGVGAARPFHEELGKSLASHYSGGVEPMLRGETISHRGGRVGDEHTKGMEPYEKGDHIDIGDGTQFHTMWKRPSTDEEKRERAVNFYKAFARHREWAGGRPDPVFFGTDTEGFRKMDPSNFGILHVSPKPGAQGYRVPGMGEWRTASGDAVDIVHHQKTAAKANPLDGYDVTHDVEDGPTRLHSIMVNKDDEDVAHISWHERPNGKHSIEGVYVEPQYERRGIASELLRRARSITPGLMHSDELSPEGLAWSQKVGRWLPHDRIFGPGHGGLDPRLFDDKKRMRPEISGAVLGTLDAFWRDTYPDWREWTHVYLAGSEASEWYGNNDFDTLLGIDHKKLRRSHPEFADMLDEDIDAYLTKGLRDGLTAETGEGVWFVVPSGTWLHDEHSNPMLWQKSSGATPTRDAQRRSSLASTESMSRRSAGISESLGSVEIWHDETASRQVERPSSARSAEHRLLSSRGSASPASLGTTGRTTSGSSTASPSRTTSDSWSSRVAAAASAIARRGRSASRWTTTTPVVQARGRAASASEGSSASGATTRSATSAKNTSTPLSLMWLAEPHGLPDGLVAIGPFEMTWFVNPNSWDIRDIKPYAAYDITRSRWIVEPVHPASDWGPEKLPSAFWDEAESIVKQVHAIEAMPEPIRSGRAAALYDYLHGDRRRAFGPHGTGVYDPGNATWKYLDMHPDHPLGILIDLKKRYENALAGKATA